jgi:hypothetical protein
VLSPALSVDAAAADRHVESSYTGYRIVVPKVVE